MVENVCVIKAILHNSKQTGKQEERKKMKKKSYLSEKKVLK
jgi:hypothetical protein